MFKYGTLIIQALVNCVKLPPTATHNRIIYLPQTAQILLKKRLLNSRIVKFVFCIKAKG